MTCEQYQQTCYDLLDYNLSPKAERALMAHIASCPACQQFLEAEQARMRQWPRLFDTAAQDVEIPADVFQRVAHAMELSHLSRAPNIITATKIWCSSWHLPFSALAASLAMLFGIAALFGAGWALRQREPVCVSRIGYDASADSSIKLLSQRKADGVELPSGAPGTIRVASGEIRVKLGSGVEISLLGPAEMMVENTMQVWLESGDLLAHVPPQAIGFQVQTTSLDIWDRGTIFSVSAREGLDSVFVFKGSVRVSDAVWDIDDTCLAGEGFRSQTGIPTLKVAADFTEAKTQFQKVSGTRSLRKISESLAAAEQITTLWMDHYLPKTEGERRSYFAKEAARLQELKRLPFSTQPWVRPAVPLTLTMAKRLSPLQKEENMKMKSTVAAMAASATLMGAGISSATSAFIQVDTAAHNNRHWMTVFTNEVPLTWEWPATATSATLKIVGMSRNETIELAPPTSSLDWQAFTGAVPAADDVYDLTLTFRNSGASVVSTLTSRLAIIKAAFGATPVDTGAPDKHWNSLHGNVVLPYDGLWSAATSAANVSQLVIAKEGGMTQTNSLADASGYLGWKLVQSEWGTGTFNLALSFPGAVMDAWRATLTRVADGTVIIIL